MALRLEQFYNRHRRVAEWILYIYTAECVLGCSGRWMSFGPVSIRMILFTLAFLATLPAVILDWKRLLKSAPVILTAVFFVFLLRGLVFGLQNGNQPLFIRMDLTCFLGLALLPGILAVTDSREKLDDLLNVIFLFSVILAVITAALHFMVAFAGLYSAVKINFMLILPRQMGALGLYDSGVLRIYLKSQVFLQFAFLIGLKKAVYAEKKKRLFLGICLGLIVFAVVLSFTRGFWLGLGISILLAFVFQWNSRGKLFRTCLVSAGCFLILLGASCAAFGSFNLVGEIAKRFDPNLVVLSDNKDIDVEYFYKEFGINAEENIDAIRIRKESLKMLRERIAEKPLLGHGLGANLDGIREDGRAEYMYLDIFMKMGLGGLLAFALLCLSGPVIWFRGRLRHLTLPEAGGYVMAAFLGLCVTSAFNPYLSTPMGLLMLSTASACALVPGCLRREGSAGEGETP